MPKEWSVVQQGPGGTEGPPGYRVSSRKVGIFGAGKPIDAGMFNTREEADAFVTEHRGRDDSVTHIAAETAEAR